MKKLYLIILLAIPFAISGCQEQPASVSWAWQAGVAVGTIALAVVTLLLVLWNVFGPEFLRKKQMPKLAVNIGRTSSDLLQIRYMYEADGQIISTFSYWVRLSIGNVGIQAAENVEVYLDEIWELNERGAFQQADRHIPMNLRWAVVSPDETDMEKITFIPRLNRGLDKPLNLCHVVNPVARRYIPYEEPHFLYQMLELLNYEQTLLHFDTVLKTSNESYFWPAGRYLVKVIVAASNADTIYCYIELKLNGEWFEEAEQMWREGLVARVVPDIEVNRLTHMPMRFHYNINV